MFCFMLRAQTRNLYIDGVKRGRCELFCIDGVYAPLVVKND